jgi:hypothetical protein
MLPYWLRITLLVVSRIQTLYHPLLRVIVVT